jgi:hypothetical protein
MAKKRDRGSRQGSSRGGSRKRIISLDEINKAAALLSQNSGGLQGLAAAMREHKITEIEIDGFGLLERGIDEIDRFIDNVEKGVSKAKRSIDRSAL